MKMRTVVGQAIRAEENESLEDSRLFELSLDDEWVGYNVGYLHTHFPVHLLQRFHLLLAFPLKFPVGIFLSTQQGIIFKLDTASGLREW